MLLSVSHCFLKEHFIILLFLLIPSLPTCFINKSFIYQQTYSRYTDKCLLNGEPFSNKNNWSCINHSLLFKQRRMQGEMLTSHTMYTTILLSCCCNNVITETLEFSEYTETSFKNNFIEISH